MAQRTSNDSTALSLFTKEFLDKLTVPIVIFQAIFDSTSSVHDYKVIYVNEEHRKQSGNFHTPGQYYSEFKDKLPPTIHFFDIFDNVIKTGETYVQEYLNLSLNRWFKMTLQKMGKDMISLSKVDITSEKLLERHVQFLELNDCATGLANSANFLKTLRQKVEVAKASDKKIGLIVFNIDNLSSVNDLSGREAGDQVIREVAKLLISLETDIFNSFRLDGDEFGIICSDVQDKNGLMKIVTQLFAKICAINVSVSMGISIFPDHESSAMGLFRNADLALHHIKNNGKGNFDFFESEMYDNFLNRDQIQKKIFYGIQNKQFMLYYQPQFYLEGHKLRGFEALIRWYEDGYGWRSPMSFIPIAEESNLIQNLGDWILETACSTLAKWQRDFRFDGILSVNISPAQLKNPNFIQRVKELVLGNQLKPGSLELELTEGIFIKDTVKTSEILNELKNIGIRLALDDFGTGYSSLRYLAKMPFDTIKLDKSFIDSIAEGNNLNIEIIASLVPVTKRAGMETIAEGIEKDEQLSFLTDIECNTVQGYLWGKPIPESKASQFLMGDQSALDKI